MHISEIIGIIVIECECKQSQFVTNTEAIKEGVCCKCPQCNKVFHIPRWSSIKYEIDKCDSNRLKCCGKEVQKAHDKPMNNNWAMPLAEYKAMLSKIILEGKTPRVPAKHNKVVSFNTNSQAIIDTVNTLVAMGYKYQDAKSHVTIAVAEGFYNEEEIIKRILSL